MTIRTGKLRVGSVDVHEVHTVGVDLLQRIRTALGHNQMAGVAVARGDRFFAVGRNVIAIVTTETTIPSFVSNKIRVSPPVGFNLREEVCAINRLRFFDDRVRLRGVRIGCV